MGLSDKIKFALDEGRMLILGGQVLIGFGYQSVFQPGFGKLSVTSQYLQLGSLSIMLVGLAVAMSPAARDRLVERGEPTEALLRFATCLIGWALLPFAVGLGVSAYVAVRIIAGPLLGMGAGIAATSLALAFWYGGRLVNTPVMERKHPQERLTVELKEKISHALTEARMVLPGVQTMLGFQFLAMLTDSFERLPTGSKLIHVLCLGMTTLTAIFLITPAAFHRVVERGEATERQHRVTTAFLLAAMSTLPPGITGDLFVVVLKVTGSRPTATGISGAVLGLFYLLWFGIGLTMRRFGKPAAVMAARDALSHTRASAA